MSCANSECRVHNTGGIQVLINIPFLLGERMEEDIQKASTEGIRMHYAESLHMHYTCIYAIVRHTYH